MVKSKSNNIAWKPVQLEGAALASGDFDGLIGIEECTEYDLNDLMSTDKAIKRKKGNDGSNAAVSSSSAKKKKRKKVDVKTGADVVTPSKSGHTDDMLVEDVAEELLESDEFVAWESYSLPQPLLKALKSQNFKQPTDIQAQVLSPAILGQRDILGAAETGSGKTLAFGLPILSGILNLKNTRKSADEAGENEARPLYALILTPTRELAVQVKNHLVAAAKYTDIQIITVLGGMAAEKQERLLSKGPEIVVATPGRLWELIQQGNPHLCKVDDIRYLAIDETDRMIEKGHFQELQLLLERLNMDEGKKQKRQNFVFSATLTLVHDLPRHLLIKKKFKGGKRIADMNAEQKLQKIVDILGMSNPKIIDITQSGGISSTLTECRITCSANRKDYYVYYFLQKHPGRTLVFCNSIGCVKRLTTLLGLLNCKPLALHASMQQRQRLKNLDKFREDENGILIATDVAARGLDIPSVEHVLHYQTPRTSESYIHRSGRTARAHKQGITVLLTDSTELPNYIKLCKTLGKAEDLPAFPIEENYLRAVEQRVDLARELDKLELRVKKSSAECGWFQKAADEMDIIIEDSSFKYDIKETQSLKKQAEIKRKQLAQLISRPIFPKGFSGKYLTSTADFNIPVLVENNQNNAKALDVVKAAMENLAVKKMKPKPLFKRNKFNKKAHNSSGGGGKVVKNVKKRKTRK